MAVGPVNFPWIFQTPSVNFPWNLAHFKNSIVKSRIFSRELGWSLLTGYTAFHVSPKLHWNLLWINWSKNYLLVRLFKNIIVLFMCRNNRWLLFCLQAFNEILFSSVNAASTLLRAVCGLCSASDRFIRTTSEPHTCFRSLQTPR